MTPMLGRRGCHRVPGDVGVAVRVGGDAVCSLETARAELSGPADVAVGVVGADEGVVGAGVGSFEGAVRDPQNVGVAVRVGGDAVGVVVAAGAELAGPEDVAVAVVGAEEGVAAAGVGAFEGARRVPGDVDVAVRVGGDAKSFSKLLVPMSGPADVAVGVVGAEVGVAAAGVGAFEGAACVPSDVDVAVRVGNDALGAVVAVGAELPGPEDVAVKVVRAEEGVVAADAAGARRRWGRRGRRTCTP